MGMRLFGKAIKLALRSRKRYVIFTITYTTLMIWTSFSIQNVFNGGSDIINLTVALVASIFLSILYAWIIINYRRQEIATLKCIGYTNGNVRTLIVGEIIWVTLSGFIVVLEILFHFLAFRVVRFNLSFTTTETISLSELNNISTSPITFTTLVLTLLIFLGVQIIGIILAYSRILKVRPMAALRVMK